MKDENKNKVLELRKKGMSVGDIRARTHLSYERINEILSEANMKGPRFLTDSKKKPGKYAHLK